LIVNYFHAEFGDISARIDAPFNRNYGVSNFWRKLVRGGRIFWPRGVSGLFVGPSRVGDPEPIGCSMKRGADRSSFGYKILGYRIPGFLEFSLFMGKQIGLIKHSKHRALA
jgi:hypothetical protein